MKSLQKLSSGPRQSFINLKGNRNSTSMRKYDPVKSQIDDMLRNDYSNWRVNKGNFNAANSLTARNSQVLGKYVLGIYSDYHIQDPLYERNGNTKGISIIRQQQNINRPQTQISRSKQTIPQQAPILFPAERKFVYETPVKSQNTDLEYSFSPNKFKQPISGQKSKYNSPNYINYENRDTPYKVKFIQKTAPSHESSFSLSNSRGLALSSAKIHQTQNKNNINQQLINSQLSLAQRLAKDNSRNDNFYSNQTLGTYVKPSATDFQSTRSFLSRRKEQRAIESDVSLGKINPQRQNERMKNQLYAQKLIRNDNFRQIKPLFTVSGNKIKQCFRYCPGCQQAILQANIQFHERQCNQFDRLLNLPQIQDILYQVDNKITGIMKKINQRQTNVHQQDKQNVLSSSRVMMNEVQASRLKSQLKQIINPLKSKPFIDEYNKFMNVGTNWGLLTQEVNKLKWFLHIRDNFERLRLQGRSVNYVQNR